MTCKIPTTPTIPIISNRAKRVAHALHRMRQAQSLAILCSEIARYEAQDEDTASLETEFASLAHEMLTGTDNATTASGTNCADCYARQGGLDELSSKRSVMP